MNARGVCVVLVLSLFVVGQPALQAADGWFGNSATSAGGSSSSAKKSAKSSWFSWPASKPKAKSSGRSKPSMVDNMTRSTKNTWNKTVSFLNPFDDKPAAQPTTKSQPNTGSWFSSRDTEKKPTSVPDWLGGEMPTY